MSSCSRVWPSTAMAANFCFSLPRPSTPPCSMQFAGVRHLEVWINYHEEDTVSPQPGFEQCQNGNQFERVLETFVFVAGPQANQHADVVVDGQSVPVSATPPALTIPEDESVPHQELPDEETSPRWLIRLGSVQWDGPNRRFIPAAPPERLSEARRYVGVVASDVLAPPVGLRIRPRATAADKDAADFAAVEGRLRVDGRIAARKDILVTCLNVNRVKSCCGHPRFRMPQIWAISA